MAWPPTTHQDVQDAVDTLQTLTGTGRLSDVTLRAALGGRGYLVATFPGNGEDLEKLHLHYSPDGTVVAAGHINPVYSPTGGVRDPDLMYRNGLWWLAHTINGGADHTLAVASSPDLINWTPVATVNVAAATGMLNAWAPSWAVEGSDVYLVFTNATSGNPSTWYVKASNPGLTAWGAPAAVTWNPANVPVSPMDPHLAWVGGQWVIFFGYGVGIARATAPSVTGTWTMDRAGDWAGWAITDRTYEGPQLVVLPDGRFRLYSDRYDGPGTAPVNVGMGYSEADSLDGPWTPFADVRRAPGFPTDEQIRHGAFVALGDQQNLATAMGATLTGSRPRHALFYGSGTIPPGEEWNRETITGGLTVDGNASRNPDDFIEVSGPRTLRIKRDGVYSLAMTVQVETGFANGGGYMLMQVSGEPIDANTNVPNGQNVWSLTSPPMRIYAGREITWVVYQNGPSGTALNIQRLACRVHQLSS